MAFLLLLLALLGFTSSLLGLLRAFRGFGGGGPCGCHWSWSWGLSWGLKCRSRRFGQSGSHLLLSLNLLFLLLLLLRLFPVLLKLHKIGGLGEGLAHGIGVFSISVVLGLDVMNPAEKKKKVVGFLISKNRKEEKRALTKSQASPCTETRRPCWSSLHGARHSGHHNTLPWLSLAFSEETGESNQGSGQNEDMERQRGSH